MGDDERAGTEPCRGSVAGRGWTDESQGCCIRAAHAEERARLEMLFFGWARRTSQRTTLSDAWIASRDTKYGEAKVGILIGYRNEEELREILARSAEDEGGTKPGMKES